LPPQPQATPAAATTLGGGDPRRRRPPAAAHVVEDGAANPGSVQQVGPCQRCAINDGFAGGQEPPERHLQEQTRARRGQRLGHGAANACTGLSEFRISCGSKTNEKQSAFPLQPGSSRFFFPSSLTLLGKLFPQHSLASRVLHHPPRGGPGRGATEKWRPFSASSASAGWFCSRETSMACWGAVQRR
jgi:hypothetical protein